MSQFVRVTVNTLKNVDPKIFNRMINNLNVKGHGKLFLDVNTHSIYVPGAIGRKIEDDIDCVLCEGGKLTSIGFKLRGDDNMLQIRGDFWGTGFDSEALGKIITQNYTIEKIKNDAKIHGSTLVKNTVKQDGTVVLRYAV